MNVFCMGVTRLGSLYYEEVKEYKTVVFLAICDGLRTVSFKIIPSQILICRKAFSFTAFFVFYEESDISLCFFKDIVPISKTITKDSPQQTERGKTKFIAHQI